MGEPQNLLSKQQRHWWSAGECVSLVLPGKRFCGSTPFLWWGLELSLLCCAQHSAHVDNWKKPAWKNQPGGWMIAGSSYGPVEVLCCVFPLLCVPSAVLCVLLCVPTAVLCVPLLSCVPQGSHCCSGQVPFPPKVQPLSPVWHPQLSVW